MAKSKIIQEIGLGEISLEKILTRSLIIANDLNNHFIINWINNELFGYDSSHDLPSYRKFKGILKVSYISGFNHVKNQAISENQLHEKVHDKIPSYIRDNINAIEQSVVTNETNHYNLTDFIPFLIVDEHIQVLSFINDIPDAVYRNIISKVKQSVLKFLLEAEKEFGNLDLFDINVSVKAQESFNKKINMEIGSIINIEPGNNIPNSNIGVNDSTINNKGDGTQEGNKFLWKIVIPIVVGVIVGLVVWYFTSK